MTCAHIHYTALIVFGNLIFWPDKLTFNGHIKTAEQRTIIYSNTVIGTLAVDGRAVTFGTAMMSQSVLRLHPIP